MKTAKLQTLTCLSCGSDLNCVDGDERYECKNCGEVYDLKSISSMELDLDAFDMLLLYTLKKNKIKKNQKILPFKKYKLHA
jgi:predicted RNA-binding Zn-ribbon protein involved in translation (DUF1610 family)